MTILLQHRLTRDASRDRACAAAMVVAMTEGAMLYLVYIADCPQADPGPDMVRLAPGLYLAESMQTRSPFYHALKRRHHCGRLLVALLADEPKFKGMQAGALAWLRARRAAAAGRSA